VSAIGDIVVNLRANIAQYQQAMQQSKTATVSLQSSVGSLNRVMAGLGVGVSVAGAFALGKHMLTLAANTEKTAVSFKVLTGSADVAKQVMGDITKFGAETPFELPELATATRKLLAFGVSANDILPTLRMLGDVSAGIDQPIGEIAELFGKAKVQGRLFGEDINQFTGRGIPIIQELAKQFGVAEADVKKLVEQGQVGFPHLQKAFEAMTGPGGKFAGMMKELSGTAAGQWSTFKKQVNEALRTMGEDLLPYAVEGMKQLSAWMNDNGPAAASAFAAAIRGLAEAGENAFIVMSELYDVYLALEEMNLKGSFSVALTSEGRAKENAEIAAKLKEVQETRAALAKGVDSVETSQIKRATARELDWIEAQVNMSAPLVGEDPKLARHLELIKERRAELEKTAQLETQTKQAQLAGTGGSKASGGIASNAKAAAEAAKVFGDMQKQAAEWASKAATFGMGDKDKAQRDASVKYFEDRDKIKAAGLPWDKEREAIARLQTEYGNLTRAIDDYYAKEDAAEKQKKAADATKDFADKIQALKDKLNGVTDAQKAFQEALKAGVPLEQAKALRQEYEKIEGLNRIKDQREAMTAPQQKYVEDLEKLGELTKGQKYGKDALKLSEWTEGRKQLQQAAVGGMLDSIKTPMQKANEAIADIRKWENVGALTKGQADLLVQKQIEEANKATLGEAPQSPAAQARGSAAAWSSIVGAMNEDTQAKQLAALNRIANNTAPSAASKPKQMKI
jgi:tape measure domain-containing protein